MDKSIYRMSRAGDCPRALSAERLGYEAIPFPGWLITIMEEGKRHEQWIVEDLIAEGYEVERGGVCQQCLEEFGEEREGIHVELQYPLFRLIGHLDGRLPTNGHSRPLEIKALGRFTFQKFLTQGFGAFPGYAGQETAYMTAVGEDSWPGFYIVKNRDTGKKLLLDVSEPPASMEDIIDKFNFVEALARKKELCEGECDEYTMRMCQYRYLCSTPEKTVTTEITPEVADAFKVYHDNSYIAKQVEAARAVIKKFMVENDITTPLEVNEVLAKITERERESYPKVALVKWVADDVLMKCRRITKSPVLDLKNLSVMEED